MNLLLPALRTAQAATCGTETVSAVFGLQVIAYNLIRLGNLLETQPFRRCIRKLLGG